MSRRGEREDVGTEEEKRNVGEGKVMEERVGVGRWWWPRVGALGRPVLEWQC